MRVRKRGQGWDILSSPFLLTTVVEKSTALSIRWFSDRSLLAWFLLLMNRMCSQKKCPIHHLCDHETEQLLYCRHVEQMKRIGELRLKRNRKMKRSATTLKQTVLLAIAAKHAEDLPEI